MGQRCSHSYSLQHSSFNQTHPCLVLQHCRPSRSSSFTNGQGEYRELPPSLRMRESHYDVPNNFINNGWDTEPTSSIRLFQPQSLLDASIDSSLTLSYGEPNRMNTSILSSNGSCTPKPEDLTTSRPPPSLPPPPPPRVPPPSLGANRLRGLLLRELELREERLGEEAERLVLELEAAGRREGLLWTRLGRLLADKGSVEAATLRAGADLLSLRRKVAEAERALQAKSLCQTCSWIVSTTQGQTPMEPQQHQLPSKKEPSKASPVVVKVSSQPAKVQTLFRPRSSSFSLYLQGRRASD